MNQPIRVRRRIACTRPPPATPKNKFEQPQCFETATEFKTNTTLGVGPTCAQSICHNSSDGGSRDVKHIVFASPSLRLLKRQAMLEGIVTCDNHSANPRI